MRRNAGEHCIRSPSGSRRASATSCAGSSARRRKRRGGSRARSPRSSGGRSSSSSACWTERPGTVRRRRHTAVRRDDQGCSGGGGAAAPARARARRAVVRPRGRVAARRADDAARRAGAMRLEKKLAQVAAGLERQREEFVATLSSRLGEVEADFRARLTALRRGGSGASGDRGAARRDRPQDRADGGEGRRTVRLTARVRR